MTHTRDANPPEAAHQPAARSSSSRSTCRDARISSRSSCPRERRGPPAGLVASLASSGSSPPPPPVSQEMKPERRPPDLLLLVPRLPRASGPYCFRASCSSSRASRVASSRRTCTSTPSSSTPSRCASTSAAARSSSVSRSVIRRSSSNRHSSSSSASLRLGSQPRVACSVRLYRSTYRVRRRATHARLRAWGRVKGVSGGQKTRGHGAHLAVSFRASRQSWQIPSMA